MHLIYCWFLLAACVLIVAAQFQAHHDAPKIPGFLKKADDEQWRIIRNQYNIKREKPIPDSLKDVANYKGPVDIVICWLDPKDPVWQENFKSFGFVYDPVRFDSSREIEINLASLSVYFPNCGKVYIVSDQRLDLSFLPSFFREKISFVKHTEIIDEQYLPTFSANVLEANLWKIPGLSEIFMYLNDDFIIMRPFDIDRIINAGPKIIVPSSYMPKWCDPAFLKKEWFPNGHNIDYINTNNLFIEKFGYCIPYMNSYHVPYVLSVSLNKYTSELYAEAVHVQNKNRVRNYVPFKKGGDFIFLYLSLYIGEYYGLIKFSSNYTSSFGERTAENVFEVFLSSAKKPSSDFMTLQNLPEVPNDRFGLVCKLHFTALCLRDPEAPFCDFQICKNRDASLYGDKNIALLTKHYGFLEYLVFTIILLVATAYVYKKRSIMRSLIRSSAGTVGLDL